MLPCREVGTTDKKGNVLKKEVIILWVVINHKAVLKVKLKEKPVATFP